MKVVLEQRSPAAQSKKKAVETIKDEVCLSLMLHFKSSNVFFAKPILPK